jgi:hypothetical protein
MYARGSGIYAIIYMGEGDLIYMSYREDGETGCT